MPKKKPAQAFRGLEYIRRYYDVPAKRGGRVRFTSGIGTSVLGTITSAPGPAPHIRVRIDGEDRSVPFHPASLEYLDASTESTAPVTGGHDE